MSSVVIRDDDLSFWTNVDDIERLYKPLFDKKVKISFAVIPCAVKSFNLGNFNSFYQDENSQMPIFENSSMVEYIKDKIKNGKLKPGDFLKKEDDLALDYNFSKLTVRKALSMLEAEGYIQKIKGKKSIILEKKNLENISLTSIQTVQEINKLQNIHLETDLISLYIVQGVKKLMEEFQVPESADFYKVVRTNSLNGEVLNYSTSFFDRKIVPFLNEEIAKKSIYEYLEKELNLKIAYSRRDISFRKITSEEQKYFKLEDINMVVVIETHAYLSNGTLFQYETIIHHPEKFTFSAIAKR